MAAESELRLATWNIHMAIGRDGERNLARIARVIREISPDLIGLQEVDNRVDRNGDDLQRLSELTEMTVIAGPTMQRSSGDYGNALLTRLPVLDVARHDLSVPGREPRGMLIVSQEWRGEIFRVAVAHLGLFPGERRHQVRRLIECLEQNAEVPLILMGDFNEWLFWGRPLRWLHQHFTRSRSPATFPARWPLLHLDHILSSPPWRLHTRRIHDSHLSRIASDHLPLLASYTIENVVPHNS